MLYNVAGGVSSSDRIINYFLCSGEVDVEAEGIEGLGATTLLLFDNKRLFATGASTVSVSTVSFLSSSVI